MMGQGVYGPTLSRGESRGKDEGLSGEIILEQKELRIKLQRLRVVQVHI